MDRKQLDQLVPMVYALAVMVCALWVKDALTPVAVIGAVLLGIYYAVLRRRTGEGRPRNRNR